ncbi:hypothetical protein [Bradyrhizobium sp. CCBAU 51627]|nr:hypothetical protein [Bradyrhizobium sp. CCBAU 51627]
MAAGPINSKEGAEDAFKVRFSIPKDEQSLLGEALTQPTPEMIVRPN